MSSSTVLIATPYGFNGDVGLPWNAGGKLANEIHHFRENLQSGDCGIASEQITTLELNEANPKEDEEEDLHYNEILDVTVQDNAEADVEAPLEDEDDDDDEYEDIDEEDDDDEMSAQVSKPVVPKVAKAPDPKQRSSPAKQTPNRSKRPSTSTAEGGGTKPTTAVHQVGRTSSEKLQKLRDTVEQAIRDHKIFSVFGCYPTIREALKQRGWIEKEREHIHNNKKSSQICVTTSQDDSGNVHHVGSNSSFGLVEVRPTESMLTYRLLRHVKVDLLWTVRSDPINWQEITKKQLVNRFPRAYFTTKVGLCNYLKQMHWFCEKGVSHALFPRCYNICHSEEMSAFKDDFRLTACLSLLKWLVSTYLTKGESAIKSPEGKIPFTAIEFAISRCREFLSAQNHEDIDKSSILSTWDHQWDQFLTWYYKLVHDNILFVEFQEPSVQSLFNSARTVLDDMGKNWPQYDLDGMYNIWIVKPGAKSRGRGIQLMNRLENIMEKINPAVMKESRYVVQKYIERPLLIYGTKFDIRQWFLVTSAQPLTIWMYKESYLRFCSQPFDLRNFHESVHLCNNAIQCKYKNGKRDPALPDENMWDCYTFQTYLRAIGHADMWDKHIYPGMRESIICALLAAQEHMDRRKNCFELFGADFMLTEDFSPWLIEINSCPCMAASTSVTARMCAQVLEDVVKVVVDKRNDGSASTGMFELIYRQKVPKAPPYLGMSLSVRGTKIIKNSGVVKLKKDSPRDSPPSSSPPSVSPRASSQGKPLGSPVSPKESAQGKPASTTSPKESPRVKSPVVPSSPKGSPEAKSPKVRSPTIKSPTLSDYRKITSQVNRQAKRISEFSGPVIVDMISNLANQLGKKKTISRKRRIIRRAPIHIITEKDIPASELAICTGPSCLNGEKRSYEKLLERTFGEKVPSINESAESETDMGNGDLENQSERKEQQASTESPDDLLDIEELEKKKKQMCVIWKNSSDAEKSIQFFNEWKQKLDHTRASCEDMLYKLKMFRESENLRPKYYSIPKGINWDNESATKPTISDILKKLSQAHPEKELIMLKNSQQLADMESRFVKRKPCYLNMLIEDDVQYASRRSEKSLSEQSSAAKHIAMKGILPHIKQRNKIPNPNSLHCNTQKLDNFYAIGLSLKGLQALRNQRGHLLLPLQSDNKAMTSVDG